MQKLRVAIIGGGIGGAAAAIALRQAGADVQVYEKAHQISEVGAGVTIQPNSLRVLDTLGVGDQVREVGAPQDESKVLTSEGRVTSHETDTGYGVHRADLLEVLMSALPAEIIHLEHQLDSVSQDDNGVTAAFHDGSSAQADVLVGADGIKSTVQRVVVEDTTAPVFSREVAYRGTLDAELVPNLPANTARIWLGENQGLRVYPLRRGRLINYVAFVPSDDSVGESWSAPGDPDVLRRHFAHWAADVREVLEPIESTFIWGLHDRLPLPRWSRGRITLLGDAAHAMLPTLGQGANQAIEDAISLGILLSDVDAADIPEMLIRYQALRHGRTARFQRGSRQARKHQLDPSDPDYDASPLLFAQPWVYDHDAAAAAKLARA